MVNVSPNKKSDNKTNKNERNKKNDKKATTKAEPPKQLTHIYMHEKYLDKIINIPISNTLTTLYLHNNIITKIENLDSAVNLTNLYLQKNKIRKIENLESLINLRKLYLGHNEITVVENLNTLPNLEELHLEKQTIPPGDSLCFDPRTVFNIARSLQVLNISHCNMSSINSIAPLKFLKYLDASFNKIDNTETICAAVKDMYYLNEASFIGNPVAKIHRYRENIIGGTIKLACLDNKDIHETTRCFIKRFDYEKNNAASKQNINIADHITGLPKNYSTPLQKAVSTSIIKTCCKNSFDSSGDTTTYIPWKALPRTNVDVNNKIPPLLRKHRQMNECKSPGLSTNVLNFNP